MSRRSQRRETLPVRHRLPNPPPLFLGREREVEQLAAAVLRAPLTVVWGLGGLGKTALVLHTLHTRFPDRVARTLAIGLRPGAPPEQVLLDVARALAEASGLRPSSHAWEDGEALTATLLDLAEEGELWVVLDDAHHGGAALVEELLLPAARYARRSRWIATSRLRPDLPDLDAQLLPLEGLAEAALLDVARLSSPSLPASELGRAARAAAGSPWALRQHLAGRDPDVSGQLLAGLTPGAAEFLEAISGLDGSLPLEELARLASLPDAATLEALERRGLLQRSSAGHRLHDVARALLAGGPDARVTAATALARSSHLPSLVEALRLFLAGAGAGAAALDAARAVLERHGAALLGAGYAPTLWRLVEPHDDDRLARWRLRCAVELGDGAALRRVRPPASPDDGERLLWARALLQRGELGAAVQVARDVVDRTRAAPDRAAHLVALDATLLALEVASHDQPARQAEVLATLDSLTDLDGDAAARRDAYAARCHAALGHYEDAVSLCDRLVGRLAHLGPAARDEVRLQLVAVLLVLGRVAQADAVLATLADDSDEGDEMEAGHARQLPLWQLAIAVAAGRFLEADGLRRRLAPLLAGHSLARSMLLSIEVYRRLHTGELAGVATDLDELARVAGGSVFLHDQVRILRLRLALLTGDGAGLPPHLPREPATGAPAGRNVEMYELCQRRRRRRAGELEPQRRGEPGAPPVAARCDVLVVADLVQAEAALLDGEPATARTAAARAVAAARELGLRTLLAEALVSEGEVLAATGGFAELAAVAAELLALAGSFPSPRFAAEGRWLAMAAEDEVLRPALLEELAALVEVSPAAARRSRHLLGAAAALDTVDTLVVAAVARRAGAWRIAAPPTPAAWRPGWGLDGHRRAAWLPGARLVELAATPLPWRCLEAIAARGGAATKDDLVAALWPGETYDPRRHNPRLHPLINKLRRALEDDPTLPTRLVTTDDGYAFGPEPFRWMRRDP